MSIYFQIDKDMCLCGIATTGCITIPDGVKRIGNSAFANLKKITSIIIPNSVISIGEWAFSGCNSLKRVTIPDSVQYIGVDAFYGCHALEYVTIPDSIKHIGTCAFCAVTNLSALRSPATSQMRKCRNGEFIAHAK